MTDLTRELRERAEAVVDKWQLAHPCFCCRENDCQGGCGCDAINAVEHKASIIEKLAAFAQAEITSERERCCKVRCIFCENTNSRFSPAKYDELGKVWLHRLASPKSGDEQFWWAICNASDIRKDKRAQAEGKAPEISINWGIDTSKHIERLRAEGKVK